MNATTPKRISKANAYYRHNIYQDLTDYTPCIALDLCRSL